MFLTVGRSYEGVKPMNMSAFKLRSRWIIVICRQISLVDFSQEDKSKVMMSDSHVVGELR